jgi:hypothetical protein
LAVHVSAADASDRDGAMALLRRLNRRHLPRLRHGWADGGYRGAFLAWALARSKITFEVVARADGGRQRRWLRPGSSRQWCHGSQWSREGGWWSALSRGWAGSVG